MCQGGTLIDQAVSGKPTLKVAFFFSGVKRKASIGNALKLLCEKAGFCLVMHEVDILVGGDRHDLTDKPMQDSWIVRVEEGDLDCGIYSPPCGSWSQADWADDTGPQPIAPTLGNSAPTGTPATPSCGRQCLRAFRHPGH